MPAYHLSFFAFSLDMFSFCTGPQSWRNFHFSAANLFLGHVEYISKYWSILRTFAFTSFWLDPLAENLHPPSFPSCVRAALSFFLFTGVLPRRLEPAILRCFFTQWTTPLLRNCNFASLLKGLQCLIITCVASLLSQVLQIRMPLSILNEQIGFQIKNVLANFCIALTSALSIKLVYRWVLEKESEDFLTGIVLTVWGLCWYIIFWQKRWFCQWLFREKTTCPKKLAKT